MFESSRNHPPKSLSYSTISSTLSATLSSTKTNNLQSQIPSPSSKKQLVSNEMSAYRDLCNQLERENDLLEKVNARHSDGIRDLKRDIQEMEEKRMGERRLFMEEKRRAERKLQRVRGKKGNAVEQDAKSLSWMESELGILRNRICRIGEEQEREVQSLEKRYQRLDTELIQIHKLLRQGDQPPPPKLRTYIPLSRP